MPGPHCAAPGAETLSTSCCSVPKTAVGSAFPGGLREVKVRVRDGLPGAEPVSHPLSFYLPHLLSPRGAHTHDEQQEGAEV